MKTTLLAKTIGSSLFHKLQLLPLSTTMCKFNIFNIFALDYLYEMAHLNASRFYVDLSVKFVPVFIQL